MNPRVVFVTGPAGSGRTTAIAALEDLGFETIDNMPLGLIPQLFEGPAIDRPLALGLDPRNRDYRPTMLVSLIDRLTEVGEVDFLYLECRTDVLMRRFSATRRRHPMAPGDDPSIGIERDLELLEPMRHIANATIDSSEMTPHDLRARIKELFGGAGLRHMTVTVQSFSYQQGAPASLDLTFDVRFLRNPHWVPELRPLNGRDSGVRTYITGDGRYEAFRSRLLDLCRVLLPAYRDEGKTHLSIGFGCTGGQHRSVAVSEDVAAALAKDGWRVSTRHRELERGELAAARKSG